MALTIRFGGLLESGIVNDQTELAHLGHVCASRRTPKRRCSAWIAFSMDAIRCAKRSLGRSPRSRIGMAQRVA